MIVYPEGAFYSMVKEEDIPEIVSEHLLNGRIVTRLLYQETVSEDGILPLQETEFYKKQKRIALRNCGVINPENIEEYIGTSGYEALGKVLTTMTPDDVIQVILDSGLRGRGGAGFPTGLKWKFAKGNQADQKYVCCNADEGDPGAFMDRSVLEGDPHVVLEAMTIARYGNRGVTSTSMCVQNIRSQLNVWKSQFVRRESTECLAKIFLEADLILILI